MNRKFYESQGDNDSGGWNPRRTVAVPLVKEEREKGAKSSTNSEFGSYHWFHTLVSRQKHIGEYLKNKTPNEGILREWGNVLYNASNELIQGFTAINYEHLLTDSKLFTPSPGAGEGQRKAAIEGEKEGIKGYLERRISELYKADADFCADRWNMSLPSFQRETARQMSNQVTFARQELQDILKHITNL